MDPVFKKLNFKDQAEVLVLQAPDSFQPHMHAMAGLTRFSTEHDGVERVRFAMAFVTQQEEIDHLVPALSPKLEGDALLWMCYPKKSSKQYTCDFDRDTGWEIMGKYGWEPVGR